MFFGKDGRYVSGRSDATRRAFVLLTMGLVLWMLGRAAPAQAQITLDEPLYVNGKRVVSIRQVPPALAPDPEDICIYRYTGRTANTLVSAPFPDGAAPPALRAAESSIVVTFEGGFPEPAKEALRRAANMWERYIRSPVQIRIDAAWVDTLGARTLAAAGPHFVFAFEFANGEFVAYPNALADVLAGEDLRPGASEIDMIVNAKREDWYFGTEEPAQGQIDFTSVALHEITHGLGFFGSMRVENIDADADQEGLWGIDFNTEEIDGPVPVVYDLSRSSSAANPGEIVSATEDELGRRLTNTDVYPNPSEQLANALVDSVLFNGPQAAVGTTTDPDAPDDRPVLYAPEDWNPGSSYSHLDEGTYPEGDVNSLMTPFIGAQERIQSPGGIVCGIFADMGWPLGMGCELLLDQGLVAFGAELILTTPGAVEVVWVIGPTSDLANVEVQRSSSGESGTYETIATVPVEESELCERGPEGLLSCELIVEGLAPGDYFFRLLLDGGATTLERTVTIGARARLNAVQVVEGGVQLQFTIFGETSEIKVQRSRLQSETFTTIRTFNIQSTDVCVRNGAQFTCTLTLSDVPAGNVTYRVKVVESGNISAAVEVFVPPEERIVEVFPNPFYNVATLRIVFPEEEPERLIIEIFDTLGQLVRRYPPQEPADQEFIFDRIGESQLAAGMYFVRVRGGDFTAVQQVVVVH